MAAQSETVSVEPTETFPGGTVSVEGSGFRPNEGIWLSRLGTEFCTFGEPSGITDADGSFSIDFTIRSDFASEQYPIMICREGAPFLDVSVAIRERDPVVEISLINSDVELERVPRGVELTFAVSVTDASEETLTFLWDPSWPTGELQEGTSTEYVVDTSNIGLAAHVLESGAFEGPNEQFLEFGDITFTVVNQPPDVDLSCPEEVARGAGGVIVTATASDPDGAQPSIEWSLDSAAIEADGDQLLIPTDLAGQVAVEVVATDVDQALALSSCTIQVEEQAEEVVEEESLSVALECPESAVVGDGNVSATAEVSDLGGSELAVVWTLNGETVSGDDLRLEIPTDTPGQVRVSVTVEDVEEGTASDSCEFEIEARQIAPMEPLAVELECPLSPTQGDDGVVATAMVSGPGSTEPTIQWVIDGRTVGQGGTQLAIPTETAGEVVVSVSVATDDGREKAEDVCTIEILRSGIIPPWTGQAGLGAALLTAVAVGLRRLVLKPVVNVAALFEGGTYSVDWPDGPDLSWRCHFDYERCTSTLTEEIDQDNEEDE